MSKTTPDLGNTYPAGHPTGRVWQAPTSLEQAEARVVHEMRHLKLNCRDGIDVSYARQCFDEAVDDYIEMATTGTVDEWRNAALVAENRALEAQVRELKAEAGRLEAETREAGAEAAALQAEAIILEAMRGLGDGELS